jgi:hypothetical protein
MRCERNDTNSSYLAHIRHAFGETTALVCEAFGESWPLPWKGTLDLHWHKKSQFGKRRKIGTHVNGVKHE